MAAPILLIHGAWHASWCWQKIQPLLIPSKRQIITLDLPGHGESQENFAAISLQTYVDFTANIIKTLNEPVILVGHSLAGVLLSQLAENFPELIEQLIYVAAFIPENGGSLTEEARKAATSGVGPELLINLRENSAELKKSPRVQALFYHLCTKETAAYALSMLQPEPYRAFVDTITITPERFGQIKKTYIECSEDKAVLLADQKRMHSKANCHVLTIRADHSPFLSVPKELAEAILGCVHRP